MKLNNFLKPPKMPKLPDTLPAEALVFPILSGYHTYQDYKSSSKETKNQTLAMRLFVLAGTSIGAVAGFKTFSKILEKNSKLKLHKIKQDAISSIGVPLGGIAGGFVSGSLAEGFCSFIFPPSSNKKTEVEPVKIAEIKKIDKKLDKKTGLKERLKQIGTGLFTITGATFGNIAYMKLAKTKNFKEGHYTKFTQRTVNLALIVAGGFAGLLAGDSLIQKKQSELNKKTIESADFLLTEMTPSVSAFDSVSEKNLKKRVKNGFYEIISSIVIPSSIVLPSLYLLRNFIENDKKFDKYFGFLRHVSTKRMTQKMLFEKSISIPLAVGTYVTGNYIGDIMDKKVTQKVLEQKFWDDLEGYKQQSMQELREGIKENNLLKSKKALKNLEKINDISNEAKQVKNAKTTKETDVKN